MRFRALRPLLASLSLLPLTAAYCVVVVGQRFDGTWGGSGILIVVKASTATLSYNCGSGTMNVPADIADDGRFEATGEHIRRGGAPPRPGDVPDRHPAHYAGRVRGDVMTLSVLLTDIDQTLGTFELARGRTADLLPCP